MRFSKQRIKELQKLLKEQTGKGTLRLYKEVLIREANNQLGRVNGDIKMVRVELDELPVYELKQ